jgi:hypothetical protein
MDFSKLSQNEKLALYGAVAVFLGGVISNWGGLAWLAVLAAVGVVVVLLVPGITFGSKGTLLAALGLVALGSTVIELLRFLNYFFRTLTDFQTIAFVVAIIGAAVMAYAGWTELQREGGKWQFGTGTAPAGSPPPAAPAPEASAPAPEPDPMIERAPVGMEPMAPDEPDAAPEPRRDDRLEDDRPTG